MVTVAITENETMLYVITQNFYVTNNVSFLMMVTVLLYVPKSYFTLPKATLRTAVGIR